MIEETSPGEFSERARAVVDLDAISRNYRFVRERVGPTRAVYAVVKADAYGHGAVAVARRLSREGADRFAVADADEGVALRRAGVAGEVLLLSRAEPFEAPRLAAYGLTAALYDLRQAQDLAAAARAASRPLPVHLELDTGMGRAGILPGDLDAAAALVQGASALRLTGTFANLSCADEPGSPETGRQVERMRECVSRLRASGVSPGVVHVANSAAILAHPDSWFDAVRPGLALYGVSPSPSMASEDLAPAMTVETRVASVRKIRAATPLGYGGRYVAPRDMTVAVLPIGYHDGFRRSFSGRIAALLRGRRAPVVGAVSMDVTLVDATDMGAARGDRVVCLGEDGGERVSAWDLAQAAGTIAYEILCGIGARVARTHRESAGR